MDKDGTVPDELANLHLATDHPSHQVNADYHEEAAA